MPRDRTQTEQRLLDAVEQIITEDGFDQVGVNRVSRQSGITKMLIYRYFGGLDGLINAYFHRRKQTAPANLTFDLDSLKDRPIPEILDTLCEFTLLEYRRLRQDVQMQELLKADLVGNDVMSNPLVNEREGQLRQHIDGLAQLLNSPASRPFTAIVMCAMTFLTFMSQQKRQMLDIDLSSDAGWSEIEMSMRRIYKGIGLLLESEVVESVEKPL